MGPGAYPLCNAAHKGAVGPPGALASRGRRAPLPIESRQLRQIVMLASAGSFAGAARRLGLTSAALVRNVQTLERDAGVRLFVREHRSVRPTPAGELLLARAVRVLAGFDGLRRDLERAKGDPSQLVRVGAGAVPRARLLPCAIARLAARAPGCSFDLRLGTFRELIGALLRGELDLFVGECREAAGDPRFEVTRLTPETAVWVACAGHPLAARRRVPIAELAEFPIALPSMPERFRALLRSLASAGTIVCDDAGTLAEILRQGHAVGAHLRSLVERELRDGTLVELSVEAPQVQSDPGIVRRSGASLSPLAEALVAELRAADAGPPEPDGVRRARPRAPARGRRPRPGSRGPRSSGRRR